MIQWTISHGGKKAASADCAVADLETLSLSFSGAKLCRSICREDGVPVLELYLGFVAGDTADMDAPALQQLELERILAYAEQAASRQAE